MNPLFEELQARGLMNQTCGNIEKVFSKPTTFYIGIDPTADSLGVHHMIGLMVARILQRYGHKPIILVGGATCAIGDPSGKTSERPSITMETVNHNVTCVKKQIEKIIDFNSEEPNCAMLVDNNDWYKDFNLIDFLREVGKKLTVNYMMAKENVRKRLERDGSGISLQEFFYGALQGYDFVHLFDKYGCMCQIAGSDNLGNIVTGTELLHKMRSMDDVCGITWDLVTCADGRKFGKSEGNTVWLDANKTSPYEFYQFWLNQTDEDSEAFIKKFTLIPLDEIDGIIKAHRESPSSRLLQKELAKYMTLLVHGQEGLDSAMAATNILFGRCTKEELMSVNETVFLGAMKDVKKVEVPQERFDDGLTVLDCAEMHDKVPSRGEARKLIKANGFSINKDKVSNERDMVTEDSLICGKYMLLQKGKKEYTLLVKS